MNDLVLHSQTQAQLQRFIAEPIHAVLLTGAEGAGKGTLATYLAAASLKVESILNHPYTKTVIPDERSTISIDVVRELQQFLRLRTTGQERLRRAIILEHADTLTFEAQNAFLKLLEEPPADTLIILTAAHMQALLPTIYSRVQVIAVRAPGESALTAHFAQAYKDPASIKQAYFLSGGLPGLMSSLLDSQSEHPLIPSVNQAKELLRQTALQRLAAADALSKQKDSAVRIVEALQRISRAGLHMAAQKQDTAKLKKWLHIHKQALEASDHLAKNANTKLVLTKLVSSI